jgi:acetyl-CoA hydrolase
MLADHVEKNNLQGKLKYSLFVGASSGAETEVRCSSLKQLKVVLRDHTRIDGPL